MTTIFDVSTTDYENNIIIAKIAMSHLQTNCRVQDGFAFSEPKSRFGWTFFQMALKPELRMRMEEKFSNMIQKYRDKNPEEKLANFLSDYLETRDCKVKLKLVSY